MRVGVLHGNRFPSWVTDTVYLQYGRDFFSTFESTFANLTRIPSAELERFSLAQRGNYFHKEYDTRSTNWERFLRRLAAEVPGS